MKKTIIQLRKSFTLTALLLLLNSTSEAQSIYTIAGTGTGGYTGDGGAATSARLDRPMGMAFDAQGNIYIADSAKNVIRMVNVNSNIITTIAGTGSAGSSGDGSAATSATLNAPVGIAIDASGNLYISEASGHVIRKINSAGIISTIAGTGVASSTGDGGSASSATINTPTGLAIDASGNLFIAEAEGNYVRKINSSGIISTIAGTGSASSGGDGGDAGLANINGPTALAFDASGNLYITESRGHRVRKINSSGNISTYAGTGTAGSSGDGGLATAARLRNPTGIVFDNDGNLYIAESNGRFVRKVSPSDTISTIAGTGVAGYTGDGNDAILATFRRPSYLAFNRGNVFVSDFNTRTVRMICMPEAPLVTAALSYCKGASASLLNANGTNLKWYADDTTTVSSTTPPTPSTSAPGTTQYYVSQTSFVNTCESPRAIISVTINDLPAAPIVSPALSFCKGTTATALSATGSNLKWYTVATGGTGSSSTPTPSTTMVGTQEFYVSQTSSAALGSCEGSRSKITVTINDLPTAPSVSAPTINVCVGGTATLSATGTNLKWYTTPTGGTASTTTPITNTSSAGTTNYYVTQTSSAAEGACESNRSAIAVVVNAIPAAPTVTSTINLCLSGPSSTLTATGSNLKWYDAATAGSMLGSAPTPSTTSTGTTDYYVSQSLSPSLGGCESNRSKISVVVNDNPTAPTVTTPINLCIGGSTATLTASGSSIKWYNVPSGGTGSTIAPTPTVSGTGTTYFYATQTSTVGCESPRSAIEVRVQPLPIVGLTSLASTGIIFCEGKTITLEANAPTAIGYSWKTLGSPVPGASTDRLNVGTTGITSVEVVDVYGCKSVAELYVQQDTSNKPTLNPPVSDFCTGSSTVFTCNPGFATYQYQWHKDGIPMTPATPFSNTRLMTEEGSYYVVVTNNFGCIDTTNESTINYYPTPVKPTITNLNPLLQVPSGYTYYQWYRNNAPIVGANSPNFTISSTGYYFAEVSNEYGCTINSDTLYVAKTNSVHSLLSANDLKIFPNPTKGWINIEAPKLVHVKLFDLFGKLILEEQKTNKVNIENCSDGMYILQLFDEENKLIDKFRITKTSQ